MTLIEQAIQAEQEYQLQMREVTDRLKNIQSYLGLIYIQEQIVRVKSVSVENDMVHLVVDCSVCCWGVDEDISCECDIPLVIFNATDKELDMYRALSLAREAVEKLPDVREEYQRNLSVLNKEFDSYEEACEYLEQFNGSYSDKAVRFKDYTLKNKTQTQKTLENKVQECGKELSALKRPTQKTLTCPHCGKRTSLNLFWGYRCEHCHSDVTPKTKAIKAQKLEEKIATMRKKINELELKRRTKKFVVKYAVKVEVHC